MSLSVERRVVERLHWAAPTLVVVHALAVAATRVTRDDGPPKFRRRQVGVDLPHLPAPAKLLEQVKRRVRAHALASVTSHHEELGDVPDVARLSDATSLLNEGKSGDLPVDAHDVRVPPGVLPVGRKRRQRKPSVVSDVAPDELSEVVPIELKQILEQRSVRTLSDLQRRSHRRLTSYQPRA